MRPNIYRRNTREIILHWPVVDGVKSWNVFFSLNNVDFTMIGNTPNTDARLAYSVGQSFIGGINTNIFKVKISSLTEDVSAQIWFRLQEVRVDGTLNPVDIGLVS